MERLAGKPAMWLAYRTLFVLWRDLRDRWPSIALDDQGNNSAVPPWDIEYHLYRRVIEIRDGILAGRPLMSRLVLDQAAAEAVELGLTGDALRPQPSR